MMKPLLNHLLWIEELLPHDVQVIEKHGGQAYFQDGKMVLILVENPDRIYEHKGVAYPFDLWKGCIFPIEQKKQNAFIIKYLFLENHPAHKDWLYIPAESEYFDEEVKQMLREISKRNPLLGVLSKSERPIRGPGPSAKPVKKKTAKKIKADKKRENHFILSMVKKEKA